MANNLKRLREERGWSQTKLAKLMGTGRSQIAKLEAGERRLSDEWIEGAAKAFGIDPGQLVSNLYAGTSAGADDASAGRGRTYLAVWRAFRDLSLGEASERIGIDADTLSDLEAGDIPYNQDLLEKAALAYRCDPADLLNIDPTKPDPPRLVYDQLKNASPDVRDKALAILQALLKAS